MNALCDTCTVMGVPHNQQGFLYVGHVALLMTLGLDPCIYKEYDRTSNKCTGSSVANATLGGCITSRNEVIFWRRMVFGEGSDWRRRGG